MIATRFKCTTYPTSVLFLDAMRPYLEADEARYGLMLGLAERVVRPSRLR